jgi:hypothetical protein
VEKLLSLRNALTAAVPEIARDPSKLTVFAKAGSSVATGAGESLSWEYRYTATLLLLDFAGDADHVTAAVHAWVRVYQPELLDNAELRERGIQFEAELLNAKAVDLQITLQLTEAVRVLPRAGAPETGPAAQRWEITHLPEPPRMSLL